MLRTTLLLTVYNGGYKGSLNDVLGQLTILLICAVCLFIFIGALVWGVKWLGIGLKREHPLIVLAGVLSIVIFIVIACWWSGCFV